MPAQSTTGSILFDTGPLGTGSLFDQPTSIIEAWHAQDVTAAFDALERAQASGKWLAGTLSYELGYALIPKLAAKMPTSRNEPLLRFGVFEKPEQPAKKTPESHAKLGPFASNWTFEAYRNAFETVHDYLKSGDVYQCNLTFPLTAQMEGCPLSLYHALRRKQPVPHGAFVDLGGDVLLSRSPELFFSVSKTGEIRTRPMKGTIRRSDVQGDDDALKAQLARSEKDQAENLMITDLLRNDLSRISKIGSVRVPKLFEIESYATVHQMVSEVVAQTLPNIGLRDIFTALFPCGSITGAPKIRAMEILSETECDPRGTYCGAIGWIAPDGSMEFNVAIRTLICRPSGEVTLNVGGGIVYDSTAQSEFEEARLKARFASNLSIA